MNPREYPEVCFKENFWMLFFSFSKVWENYETISFVKEKQ